MSLEFKANLSYIVYAISRGYIGRACLKKQKKNAIFHSRVFRLSFKLICLIAQTGELVENLS